jgi:hypothetical protein
MGNPEPTICNYCRKPIDDPVEAAKERRYLVKAKNKELPIQRKHDACDAAYAAERTGLEKVGEE